MLTCFNCANPAHYTYRLNEDVMTHYCSRHVPKFLSEEKRNGLLELYVPPKASKKKSEPVVEEVVEEVVVDVREEAIKFMKENIIGRTMFIRSIQEQFFQHWRNVMNRKTIGTCNTCSDNFGKMIKLMTKELGL